MTGCAGRVGEWRGAGGLSAPHRQLLPRLVHGADPLRSLERCGKGVGNPPPHSRRWNIPSRRPAPSIPEDRRDGRATLAAGSATDLPASPVRGSQPRLLFNVSCSTPAPPTPSRPNPTNVRAVHARNIALFIRSPTNSRSAPPRDGQWHMAATPNLETVRTLHRTTPTAANPRRG